MTMIMKDIHTRRVAKREEPPQPPPPTYNNTSTPRGSVASPPLSSCSSSPSHDDFSFTISLHPSSAEIPAADGPKTKPSTPSFTAAADLSPADDIFLHGHLLPLRLLSHLPISPRSSTNSVDSFTLPIIKNNFQNSTTTTTHLAPQKDTKPSNKDSKPKSPFSFFRLSKRKKEIPLKNKTDRSKTDPTVLKGLSHSYLDKEEKDDYDKEKQWKKLKFEIAHAVKRYVRMMKPLLSSFKSGGGGGGGGRRKVEVDRKAHSFSSGTIRVTRSSRSDNNIINKRSAAAFGGGRGLGAGEYSAPASTRTSPTNSGLLVAPPRPPPSESTMEELQAAIQAAIAHCKKSIAVEEGEDQRKSNATVA
ncbi:unnamed protein product [Cuscuta campestris]|uniref:BRI1 kinase inhibitor 1 n=1 Tax=Cuscuta campestris TaxID=132261 RepID=A0A484MEB8_9ASTE|nr:unnamed protein product [Cuscuta campestris]